MRTLLISELFPPRVGGSARWFYEVYSRYPIGESAVLTDRQPGDEVFDARSSVTVVRRPMSMVDWGFLHVQSARQYLRGVKWARRLVRHRQIQTVHGARVLPEGVVAYLLWRISGIPYCVYAHGEEIGTALSSRQLTLLMRRVYGAARAIIANSRNTCTLLRGIGVPEARVTLINPGVDIRHFSPTDTERARRRLGFDGQTIVLSVGRLQRRKGHDMMIRALPSLAAKRPDIQYVIVGTGDEEARLHQIAEEVHVSQRVHFAGRVPHEQLPDYYRACDVFVLPNREEAHQDIEGFGIVFLEANACGKPAVGGKSGGTSDAIVDGETGLLVDGENTQEIATALLWLLDNRIKAIEMGQRGRTRAVEHFSWDRVTERIRKLEMVRQ